jgi:hypothetical protein
MANPLDVETDIIRKKLESVTEADLLEVELQRERARAQAAEARVRSSQDFRWSGI